MPKDQNNVVRHKVRLITLVARHRVRPYPYAIPTSKNKNRPLTGQEDILTDDNMVGKEPLTAAQKGALEANPPTIINPDLIYHLQNSREFNLDYEVKNAGTENEKRLYLNGRDYAEFKLFTVNPEFCAPSKKEYKKGKHIFYIEDQEAESLEVNVEYNRAFEAEKFVREGSVSRWQDVLMLANFEIKEYNMDPNTLSTTRLERLVIEIARKNPDVVLKLNSKDSETIIFALKILKKNIVTKKNGTDFYYGSQFIGTTFQSVMEFILDHNNEEKISKWQNMIEEKVRA